MALAVVKNKGGRPPKTVNLDTVEKLAGIGCTHEEIAYALDMSVDTLVIKRGFSDAFKKGSAAGRRSLRHKQYQMAVGGSVPLLIWLGKQYLGQQETVTTEHTGEVTINDGAREKLIGRISSFLPPESPRESDSLVN